MNDALTHKIIGAAYEVHNTLGAGFLEKVYENSLCFDEHIPLSTEWTQLIKPFAYFLEYIKEGYLPFVFEGDRTLSGKA